MKNYELLYELNYFFTFVKFLATFATQIFNLIRVKNLLRDGQKCFRVSQYHFFMLFSFVFTKFGNIQDFLNA